MKIYLSLILIALCACAGFGQSSASSKPTDLERAGYRGQVKSIDTFGRSFDPQTGWSSRRLSISQSYNAAGNTAERSVFRDGTMTSKVIMLYDAGGRNIGDNSYSRALDKTFTIPSKTEYILDDAGNTVQMNVYYQGAAKPDLTYTYKYDARGNKIESNFGPRIGKSLSTFDDANNLTSIVNINGAGEIYNKTLLEYNDRHQEIKSTAYESEMLRYVTTYRYDAQNRLAEREIREFNAIPGRTSSEAPATGKTVYIYHEQDKTYAAARYLPSGLPIPNSTTVFNREGKEIGIQCENDELKSCPYTYEYQKDAQDNLTKKIYYRRTPTGELIPYSAEERDITYY